MKLITVPEVSRLPNVLVILLSASLAFGFLLTQDFNNIALGMASDSNLTSKSKTPINHIIVISQGKRSFDNYFGTFPGVNGYPKNLAVPLNPFPEPSSQFSVGVWFNTNNTFQKIGFVVNKGGLGVDTPGKNMNYGIWMNNRGNILAGFETKNGVDYVATANGTYNDGTWHNALVTYDGNSLNLFMDGKLAAHNKTGEAIPDLNGIQPIRIGANSLNLDNYYIGLVDELRIWNRTLDNSEVLTGYNNNTYDTNGQLAYLSFDPAKSTVSNAPSSSYELNGIYLNGSSYRDVESTLLQNFKPFSLEKTQTEAPQDDSEIYETSYNKGKMNGFLFAQHVNGKDPDLVLGYYDNKTLPYYWQFASEFVLADNFFAPSMKTGLANHQYLYTASSVDYQKNTTFRGFIDLNKTIFDELQARGHSWKVYVEDYEPALNYTNDDTRKNRFINLLPAIPRFVDNKTLNSNIVDLVQYFRDLRNDSFPAVSYIVAPASDETAPRDVIKGQEFVSSLVLALMKSKHWNDSLFIITYRESGGWYDHVKPPVINGEKYGFRVPTLIISPFAKKGYVDSTFYDVTSILKFIEYNYGLPPLSVRDVNASNLLNAFDFSQPPTEGSIYYTSALRGVEQGIEKNVVETENVIKTYHIYLLIISLILVIGVILWWSIRRSKVSLDFIKDN